MGLSQLGICGADSGEAQVKHRSADSGEVQRWRFR